MSEVTFADVVHPLLSFSTTLPADALILELIDTRWVQRLRDISQTSNTRLVYMFSEHSRFGHSIGVAYLAKLLMDKLAGQYSAQIERYRRAVNAAALLHDLGHLAPGSHTAFKTWFPNQKDSHEELTARLIRSDLSLQRVLGRAASGLPEEVVAILSKSPELPPWTWEIISGGGWNVDRGNWCTVDSVLAGVSYGKYNVAALTDAMILTADGHLALRENRLDAMMHFVVSRHAMYRQIYQHRVLLAADTLNRSIVRRARDIGADHLNFCDEVMRQALGCRSVDQLELESAFKMRECWWRYHLMRWSEGRDPVLRDLSDRLLHRRLFKTVRITDEDPSRILEAARRAVEEAGYDPAYYLHLTSTTDLHTGDAGHSMLVQMDDGRLRRLSEADPLFNALAGTARETQKSWIVVPAEAKPALLSAIG